MRRNRPSTSPRRSYLRERRSALAGQLDIGLTTLQNLVVLNGNSQTDVVAIALVDSSNGADAVVAKKQYGAIKDLKGKTVALTLGEVNHFLFLSGLKQAGIAPASIRAETIRKKLKYRKYSPKSVAPCAAWRA